MKSSRSSMQTLLAVAALSMAGSGMPLPAIRHATQRREKPKVQRMVTSASDEIKAWNAAVDARKKAKSVMEPKP